MGVLKYAILRQREQNDSSMSHKQKKLPEGSLKTGREETRTPTPKAPVPKTGASTIPPLVRTFKILQTTFAVKFIYLPRFQKICSKGSNKLFSALLYQENLKQFFHKVKIFS